MKYLKQFESFYYGDKERTNQILTEWGVNPEDFEDLFLWFSDEGYKVELRPNLMGNGTSFPKKTIWVTIPDMWRREPGYSYPLPNLYNDDVMEETRNVIRGLTKLGLYSDSPKRYMEDAMMIFIISKIERIGESFNSGFKDLSWEEWDVVLTYMNERFTPSEMEQTIRVIERCEVETKTEIVQNFGKAKTPTIMTMRQYKRVPESREFPDGRMIFKNIEIYKKLKGDDPNWFYIHLENYEDVTGDYFECDTFEDFIEKLESILLHRD